MTVPDLLAERLLADMDAAGLGSPEVFAREYARRFRVKPETARRDIYKWINRTKRQRSLSPQNAGRVARILGSEAVRYTKPPSTTDLLGQLVEGLAGLRADLRALEARVQALEAALTPPKPKSTRP